MHRPPLKRLKDVVFHLCNHIIKPSRNLATEFCTHFQYYPDIQQEVIAPDWPLLLSTGLHQYLPAVFSHIITYFCLCAICALTWASTLVGSCTASFPSTLIKLEILTKKQKKKKKKENTDNSVISSLARYDVIRRRPFLFPRLSWLMVSVYGSSSTTLTLLKGFKNW